MVAKLDAFSVRARAGIVLGSTALAVLLSNRLPITISGDAIDLLSIVLTFGVMLVTLAMAISTKDMATATREMAEASAHASATADEALELERARRREDSVVAIIPIRHVPENNFIGRIEPIPGTLTIRNLGRGIATSVAVSWRSGARQSSVWVGSMGGGEQRDVLLVDRRDWNGILRVLDDSLVPPEGLAICISADEQRDPDVWTLIPGGDVAISRRWGLLYRELRAREAAETAIGESAPFRTWIHDQIAANYDTLLVQSPEQRMATMQTIAAGYERPASRDPRENWTFEQFVEEELRRRIGELNGESPRA